VVDSAAEEVVVEPVVDASVVVDVDEVHAPRTSAATATRRRRGLTGIRLPALSIKSYGPNASEQKRSIC
jgi:hypothetical protein